MRNGWLCVLFLSLLAVGCRSLDTPPVTATNSPSQPHPVVAVCGLQLGDPVAQAWGEGATHLRGSRVERLVAMRWTGSGVELIDTAPIQLEMTRPRNPAAARNWEGLVRLGDDGFLVVTDKYPTTLLAYISR